MQLAKHQYHPLLVVIPNLESRIVLFNHLPKLAPTENVAIMHTLEEKSL